VGAGVGIGIVFGALILGVARNPSQLFSYAILELSTTGAIIAVSASFGITLVTFYLLICFFGITTFLGSWLAEFSCASAILFYLLLLFQSKFILMLRLIRLKLLKKIQIKQVSISEQILLMENNI
jgi:F0F1-type ATP synthase membrane subunit c/vacuolar-type H+-ATPase subunit K